MRAELYDGWTIPAGSMVIPNMWYVIELVYGVSTTDRPIDDREMVNDEANFPNPCLFSPERHLNYDNGKAAESTIDPTDIIFGFGRRFVKPCCHCAVYATDNAWLKIRICPGRFFADATVWLTVANVLAFFDIGPIVDPESGKELLPDGSYHSGFAS